METPKTVGEMIAHLLPRELQPEVLLSDEELEQVFARLQACFVSSCMLVRFYHSYQTITTSNLIGFLQSVLDRIYLHQPELADISKTQEIVAAAYPIFIRVLSRLKDDRLAYLVRQVQLETQAELGALIQCLTIYMTCNPPDYKAWSALIEGNSEAALLSCGFDLLCQLMNAFVAALNQVLSQKLHRYTLHCDYSETEVAPTAPSIQSVIKLEHGNTFVSLRIAHTDSVQETMCLSTLIDRKVADYTAMKRDIEVTVKMRNTPKTEAEQSCLDKLSAKITMLNKVQAELRRHDRDYQSFVFSPTMGELLIEYIQHVAVGEQVVQFINPHAYKPQLFAKPPIIEQAQLNRMFWPMRQFVTKFDACIKQQESASSTTYSPTP